MLVQAVTNKVYACFSINDRLQAQAYNLFSTDQFTVIEKSIYLAACQQNLRSALLA